MDDRSFNIKSMSREEVDLAMQWAAEEGWNPGIHDAQCFFTADDEGFWVGVLGDEPIASISAVKYSEEFAFIGFYIVKPAYRGKGYGMKMWNHALDRLMGCSIGLDGVLAQQDNYKKSGFELSHRNIRYEGCGGGPAPRASNIVQLDSLPLDLIHQYDQPFFPARRSSFLQSWIQQPDSQSLGIVQDDKLVGYGVIRACRSGYKIGPLFADGVEIADQLFLALKANVKASDPIYLDTPEVNSAALELAERHGMKICFETARMYRNGKPDLPWDRTFGVTSFELG